MAQIGYDLCLEFVNLSHEPGIAQNDGKLGTTTKFTRRVREIEEMEEEEEEEEEEEAVEVVVVEVKEAMEVGMEMRDGGGGNLDEKMTRSSLKKENESVKTIYISCWTVYED